MRCAFWKRFDPMDTGKKRTLLKWLFVLYGLMMLWLLLFRRIGDNTAGAGLNLQPLDTIKRYIWVLKHSRSPGQRQWAGANLFGNVLLFLPLGICSPLLSRKMQRVLPLHICTLPLIVAVELLQMVTGLGTCDVDDVLLNAIGVTIGWGVWRLVFKKCE